ncbi:MAG: alpha/beta hydrolase [Alphaproteobacteria bacterium]
MDIIIAFILVYCALAGYLYLFQRSFMYFPGGPMGEATQYGIDAPIIAEIEPDSGIRVKGWYWPRSLQESGYTIVYFHGNGQEYLARMQKVQALRDAGHGVLFAEYRGYGGNDGRPSEQGFYQDARAYIAWLHTEQGIPIENMVLYGESIGTGVAVQMASEFNARALILESAYDSTAEVAKNMYWMFPVDWLMIDQYRSIDKIGNIKVPVLFIHAERDGIIPIKHAENLFNATKSPKKFVRLGNGGHNDLHVHGVMDHAIDFLENL